MDTFFSFVCSWSSLEQVSNPLPGELHSDEESVLLDDGSEQHDLWGIRGVEDENIRNMIRDVVSELVIK